MKKTCPECGSILIKKIKGVKGSQCESCEYIGSNNAFAFKPGYAKKANTSWRDPDFLRSE